MSKSNHFLDGGGLGISLELNIPDMDARTEVVRDLETCARVLTDSRDRRALAARAIFCITWARAASGDGAR